MVTNLRCLRDSMMVGITLFAVSAWSEPDANAGSLQTQVFGMTSYEFGQIAKGQYAHAQYPSAGRLLHYWMQQALMQFGVTVKNENGLSLTMAAEGALYSPYCLPSDGSNFGYELLGPRFRWDIHHAEIMYSRGNPDAPFLSIGAGFFPFKYNPDSRNFGDYLLRINPYPQYLPTHFDSPYTRLLGLRISSTFFSSLQQDLLLTSEVYLWPIRDFSLTYLVSYNLLQFAEIGAGIMGCRMLSVDERLTTPPPESQVGHNLTFAGTKVMVRLSLDFKRYLPFKELWGKNDCRLYSEACLNGIDNYKEPDSIQGSLNNLAPGYNDIKKRLPVVIGFNVPTFGAMDVLSVEGEWWDNNFANSYWGVYPIGGGYEQNPYPWKYGNQGRRVDPYGGPWHWSIYAKKTILKNVKLTAQAARDHTILETSLTGTSNGDPEEAMDGKGNWGWMAKIEYGF